MAKHTPTQENNEKIFLFHTATVNLVLLLLSHWTLFVTVTGSGFCMWLLTTEILDVELGKSWVRPELWPIAPHPQKHQEGLTCLHTGAATHSQTGRAPQPWHIPKNKWEHKSHLGFGLYSN